MKTEGQQINTLVCTQSFLAAHHVADCGTPHRRKLAVDQVPKTKREIEFLLLQHAVGLGLIVGSFPGLGRDLVQQLYADTLRPA